MQKLLLAAGLSLLCIGTTSTALAWDDRGHRQIADIAYEQLTPAAKKKLMTILLAGDAQFRPTASDDPTKNPEADQALRKAFQSAGVWSDVIKGKNYAGQYLEDIEFNNKRFALLPNVSERERDKCKTWHYYDVPIRFKGSKPEVSESNAVNATNLALKEVLGPDSRMQCFWMYWITHIVADLHQPLHCVSNHEHDEEDGDAGGNGVKLEDPEGKSDRLNLHSFWDRAITRAIAAEKGAFSSDDLVEVSRRWLSESEFSASPADANQLDPMKWVLAGAAIADKEVYASEVKSGFKPDEKYIAAQIKMAKRQAVLAGVRLAKLLNKLLQ